jgi:hypothetical protein
MFKRISLPSFAMAVLLQTGGCQTTDDGDLKVGQGTYDFQISNQSSCPLYVSSQTTYGNVWLDSVKIGTGDAFNSHLICQNDIRHASVTSSYRESGAKYERRGSFSIQTLPDGKLSRNGEICTIGVDKMTGACTSGLKITKDSSSCGSPGTCFVITGDNSSDFSCVKASYPKPEACAHVSASTNATTISVQNYSSKSIYLAASNLKNTTIYFGASNSSNPQELPDKFNPNNLIMTGMQVDFSLSIGQVLSPGSLLVATSTTKGLTDHCSLDLASFNASCTANANLSASLEGKNCWSTGGCVLQINDLESK